MSVLVSFLASSDRTCCVLVGFVRGNKEGGSVPPLITTVDDGCVGNATAFPLFIALRVTGGGMGDRDSNTGKGALGGREERVKNESFEAWR